MKRDNRETFEIDKKLLHDLSIITGGLAGFCAVAVIQLAALETLDLMLTLSVICFAVAMPLLVLDWLMVSYEATKKYSYRKSNKLPMLSAVSILSTIVGISFIFGHFHWLVGMLFMLTTIISFFGGDKLTKRINTANPDRTDQE